MTAHEVSQQLLDETYPLTEDDVVRYEQDGWIRLPGLLDAPTVAELNERFDGLYDKIRQTGTPGDPYFTDGRYHRQHRIFNDPSRLDEVFQAVAMSERITSVARRLTRSERVLYLRSTVFEKPAEDSLPTTIHQDYPYLPFDRSGSMQFWIALHDLPAASGTLRFVSGSHRQY
ncbi:MAG TPA: phytanoyl-CoA dioxygenase family protein, partial [Ilumatobacteraceae bacterium]